MIMEILLREGPKCLITGNLEAEIQMAFHYLLPVSNLHHQGIGYCCSIGNNPLTFSYIQTPDMWFLEICNLILCLV